jgi:hypothetical protein
VTLRTHCLCRVATVALATFLALVPANASSSSLNDATRDKVNASKAVPDPRRKVGEVRLLARGGGVVVQTLLSTKLLDRVTGEIRKKEEGNWPAGDPSREAYLAALDRSRRTIETRAADSKDRRRRLLIEFAADDAATVVSLGTFRFVNGESGAIEREVLETLELPRSYVLRNMRLILADSFDVAESEVDSIGPLGPASASAATPDSAAPASKNDESPEPKNDGTPPPPNGAAN